MTSIWNCIAWIARAAIATSACMNSRKRSSTRCPLNRSVPQPLITGDDLIAAGYKPGPMFKELLTAVEDAQLDGSISTKEEAMELVREKARELG